MNLINQESSALEREAVLAFNISKSSISLALNFERADNILFRIF